MAWLILGLVVFIATHSVRIVADGWRIRFIAARGKLAWRAIYSVFALLGLVLLVYGYGASRADPVFLWNPPAWTRHAAILLMLFSFILLAAGSVPRNHIKARLGHPMFAGIKIWAFAHLIANGRLGDVLLFGCFLAWSVAGFSAARKRDRRDGVVQDAGTLAGTGMAVAGGIIAYAVFVFALHRLLIGVPPF